MLPYGGVPVAVLGASGFIGRSVVRLLGESGARVFPISRADVASLDRVFQELRPSITFNLAGYGVDPSQNDEDEAFRVNAGLPPLVAEAAAAWKDPAWLGQHLVHCGSAAEYGEAGGSLREDGPARPATLYGRSKCRGTQQLSSRCVELGLRCVTARLFTVYGPGERAGRLLPALIETARSGRPLRLSAGLQRRDFTYLGDVAEGLLRLGLSPAEGLGIVNLATGRLTTVGEFIQIAAGILGIPSDRLLFGEIPANIHEMEHDPVSIERLQQVVGWIPPTSIAEGVRKTMESGLL